jgi:hypothetical protein
MARDFTIQNDDSRNKTLTVTYVVQIKDTVGYMVTLPQVIGDRNDLLATVTVPSGIIRHTPIAQQIGGPISLRNNTVPYQTSTTSTQG